VYNNTTKAPSTSFHVSGAELPDPHTVDIAFVNHEQDEIDGTRIKVGDCLGLLAAASIPDGVVPSSGQTVQDGATVWTITEDQIVDPGDQPVIYLLNLRR
jgi:hypothetical protein